MFKIGLLTSTAMTAVTLLLTGAQGAAQAHTGMRPASRDPNNRFLCTYGFVVSAASNLDSSSYFDSAWTHVAVPIIGHGQTVRRIRVAEQLGYASNPAFTVGVYSNGPGGFPGQPIATGTGRAAFSSCAPISVRIAPTTLKRHTTYWIEETTKTLTRCRSAIRAPGGADRRRFAPSDCSGTSHSTSVYWEADPKTKRVAYVQRHHYFASSSGASSSSTTPWTKQTHTGPYLKLR